MHLKILPAAAALLCVCSCAHSGGPEPAADTKAQADGILAALSRPDHPGCAVGVYQDGKTLYEGAFGLASLEHNVSIDPQRTVFDIASVSKQFTAASILLLAQDGKLSLDDDIRKFLPEMPDYGEVITINDLLHHTSGLRDYPALRWMAGETWWGYTSEQDGFDLIARQRGLNFTPGSTFTYSNSNYFLLALIVHKASGQSLAEFAQARIFTPLGMTQTYFADTLGRVTPHRASGYAVESDGSFQARSTRWTEYGDSDVQTTVADLARWQRNFDEPKVGGAWLIEQLEQNGTLDDGTRIEYARGLEVYGEGDGHRGLRTVVHNGGVWDGFRATVMRLTQDRLSTVVLCNSDDGDVGGLRDNIADLFLADKLPAMPEEDGPAPEPEPDAVRPISEVPSNLLGTYWNRKDITVRRIEISDGKLWYVRSPESRSELVLLKDATLQMLGVPVRSLVEPQVSNGGPQILKVGGTAILERVTPMPADSNALAEYAGRYESSELGGGFVLAVEDGQLKWRVPFDEGNTLTPVFKDAFQYEEGVILMFQRDASGRVNSLILDHLWARNMVFARVSD